MMAPISGAWLSKVLQVMTFIFSRYDKRHIPNYLNIVYGFVIYLGDSMLPLDNIPTSFKSNILAVVKLFGTLENYQTQ